VETLQKPIIADHGPKLGGPRDGLNMPLETPIEKCIIILFSIQRLYNSLRVSYLQNN
jgi:hypothetical protein